MRKLVFLCALLVAAGTAQAEPLLGFYGGAGLTTGSVDNVFGSGLDVTNTSWKLFAGVHPTASPFGLEVEYLDFGAQTSRFAHGEGNAAALDAVGHIPLPVPFLSLFGKAGVSRWQVSGNVEPPGGGGLIGIDDHGNQFTWGFGGLLHFGNVAARVEYEHFAISNTDGANIVTLGVQITLL
jgi:hypothetical protein